MLSALARGLLDVVLPPACGVCGLPGERCCAACLAALPALGPPVCRTCGHPTPIPVDRCPECPRQLARCVQATAYDGSAPALVAALKDRRRRDLAEVAARVVAARCPPPPADAVLVPVPLAPSRLRHRGFNQSALIAAALAHRWDLSVADAVLHRREGRAEQRGASRTARARQVTGAFTVAGPVPAVCWLVDDVHTTGATLHACALALRRGGAVTVGAVCFARTVRI